MELQNGDKLNIKLTFSKVCERCLKDDMFTFDVSFSKLVQSVILAYCEDSKKIAELENGENTDRELRIALSDDDVMFRKTILGLLVEKSNDGAKRQRRSFGKDKEMCSGVWSATNKARESLKDDKRTDGESVVFISELLEEYAELPFGKREKILQADKIREIQDAIDNNHPFSYVSGGGYPCVMHPYKIMTDQSLQYNYVIGHAVPLADYDFDKFEPTYDNVRNLRIYNLVYNRSYGWIKPRKGEYCKISQKDINRRISLVSVGFSGEQERLVKVLMNPAGEKLYRRIIHNRPRFESRGEEYIDGFREYSFVCTIFQALIYFWGFENNARIIDPPELVEMTKERLRRTAMMYDESPADE